MENNSYFKIIWFFFKKRSYDFKIITIEEDGSEAVLNFDGAEKALNEIGNYCKDLNFEGKDEYSYVNYEKQLSIYKKYIENKTSKNVETYLYSILTDELKRIETA